MKISVIVSTYNWPEALELALGSLLSQTRLPDEIIVGDDGSGPETKAVVDRIAASSQVPVVHVWQEDRGFRLARIRNKAVMAATGDYIIQIDGDIIAERHFVADHAESARAGHFLRGSRVMLGEKLSRRICIARCLPAIRLWTRGVDSKVFNTLRLPFVARRLLDRYRLRNYVLGCNMSFFKADFLAVNGYDENFVGWGGEDSDFFRRRSLYGIRPRRLKFYGLTYHLYHPLASKHNEEVHQSYCRRPDPEIYCKNGALKHP